jgi:chemotaxis protein CheX
MKMRLIQPFINAADAVLAQTLKCPTTVASMSMEPEPYRGSGIAALVAIEGDIQGRVIFDVDPGSATALVNALVADEVSDDLVREAVCELANLVIGNAVVTLSNSGFRFKVQPPTMHSGVADEGLRDSDDTEAVVMCFETPHGNIRMNIAMRYAHAAV